MTTLGYPRHVDLSPALRAANLSWIRANDLLRHSNVVRRSLYDYAFSGTDLQAFEDIIFDRHTPTIDIYHFSQETGQFLVHLGAVEEICKILTLTFPKKSLDIRLECVKRPDVHLDMSIMGNLHVHDRLMLEYQNLEDIIGALTRDIPTADPDVYQRRLIFVRNVVLVEYSMARARFSANFA